MIIPSGYSSFNGMKKKWLNCNSVLMNSQEGKGGSPLPSTTVLL